MSKRAGADSSETSHFSCLAGDSSLHTPESTSSEPSAQKSLLGIAGLREMQSEAIMDEKSKNDSDTSRMQDEQQQQPPAPITGEKEAREEVKKPKGGKKKHCLKPSHKKQKVAKGSGKKSKPDAESDSGESGTTSGKSESTSSSESSEEEAVKQKARKSKASKKGSKVKKRKEASESEGSADSSGESSSEEEDRRKKAKKGKKPKKADRKARSKKTLEGSDESESEDNFEGKKSKVSKRGSKGKKRRDASESGSSEENSDEISASDSDSLESQMAALKSQLDSLQKKSKRQSRRSAEKKASSKTKTKSSKGSSSSEYKRVDQLWDANIHNYKLKESAEDDETEFAEYAFLVRRCFNWENKYTDTVVDIKSKQLRSVLAVIMKDCKSVSLEAEEPTIDPNTLFLYLEELRTYYKKALKSQIKAEKKRKTLKKLEEQRNLCRTLVKYLDEDYAEIKKTLYPLVEAGNITFDLLWALYKPNEIAITSCYGVWDEPRCFKVDYATKFQNMQRGEWYSIEGKYLEYDGKSFGYGDFEVDVEGFKGPRKIASLATYPLKYHRDAEGVRKKIIERGERFIEMEGMQYQFHKGLAFMKKKKQVAKININGRVMVDPGTFRRVNPNYPISVIKPKEGDDLIDLFSGSEEEEECSCCEDEDEDTKGAYGSTQQGLQNEDGSDYVPKYKYKRTELDSGGAVYLAVEVDSDGEPIRAPQRVDQLDDRSTKRFTEEELLLTSPVVLGFAFSEKLWLEFSLSGIKPITYNASAFDSLVLPPNQKDIVRALVESHKFNAAKTIDDVVQGKGKGLVAVLHGPPGTGKTLTAEGISELLRCPLYMVSAGELGTDPARLEHELQRILDIAHSWGAVLLLDEADVFLEKREVHDIHRNALVSIFLRLLEYFQGILFLTTNRVDTFDEAFQSRIHLPLRYGDLTTKAKRSVWKMFLDLVRKSTEEGGTAVAEFSDYDLDVLARHQLNGRQIKNAVRTAQALALKEGCMLDMEYVKKVLDVSETFERDLKGGTGYIDAMRSYT